MSFFRFLISWIFIKNLLKAFFLFFILGFLSLQVLKIITQNNRHKTVPDIYGLPLMKAIEVLNENGLRHEVIDSGKYNPKIKPLGVLEFFPTSGNEVKKGRKIYLTLNPSGYRKISIPNIIQVTYRNAISKLKAVGFEIGEITYQNNIGKDMVLEIRYNGKKIAPGSVLPKTTKIDMVLGNGKLR